MKRMKKCLKSTNPGSRCFKLIVCLSLCFCITASLALVGCGDSSENKSGIRFEETAVTVTVGSSKDVIASFSEGYTDYETEWTVSDESVLRLTVPSKKLQPNKARLKGLKAGSATVTAKAADGMTAEITVTVTDKSEQGGSGETDGAETDDNELKLTCRTLNVAIGETAEFPAENKEGAVYSSENSAVATVGDNGLITAVTQGFTYVTAVKEGVTVKIKVGAVSKEVDSVTVTENEDARINFYGRSKYDTSLSARMLYFTASGFDVAFYGTGLKATLLRESSDTYVPYLSVFVDGESMTEVLPLSGDRVIKLSDKSAKEYTIVSGLTEGWHVVKVRKRTAFQRGSTKMDTVAVRSFSTDGYFGYCPDKPELRIDVYGDSYSCGYGNLEDGSSMTSENTDGNLAYHALLASAVGAELNVMAASGWGVYKGSDGTASWSWANYYDKLNTKSGETVSVGGADVIIINLGANDVAGGAFADAEQTALFKEAYKKMLDGLIAQNPDALILCTYGFCSTDSRCKTAITDVVSEYSSDNVKTYFYTTVNSTTGHPDVANHRNGAKELENVLKNYGIID